eukprot:2135469-Lingulodinium_polyedra.AAC.1
MNAHANTGCLRRGGPRERARPMLAITASGGRAPPGLPDRRRRSSRKWPTRRRRSGPPPSPL